MHRFYAPEMGRQGDPVPLPSDEAQHLLRVLRLKKGSEVRVFDGRGREHRGLVEALTRSDAIVRLGEPVPTAPEPRVRVTLAQALLKGDKFDEVIRDATMLGVARIQPLLADRSEVPATRAGDPRRLERLHRVAVNSAKQCRRAVVPEILPVAHLTDLFRGASSELVMLTEPSLADLPAIPGERVLPPQAVTLVVGPEGGWDDDERYFARERGATMLTLGARTLRAERAALIALAVLMHSWGDL